MATESNLSGLYGLCAGRYIVGLIKLMGMGN